MLGSNKSLYFFEVGRNILTLMGYDHRASAQGIRQIEQDDERCWSTSSGDQGRTHCSVVLAASGLHYTEILRAFTSWLIINHLLIVVAFKELPTFSSLVSIPAPLKAQFKRSLAQSGSNIS